MAPGTGMEPLRFGGSPLAVEVLRLPGQAVAICRGAATEATIPVLAEASAALVALAEPEMVLDLSLLRRAAGRAAQRLVELISSAQRQGSPVTLANCTAELFRVMQSRGLAGAVKHSGSLSAATHGKLGAPTETVELHLRSVPDVLPRLHSVAEEVATRAAATEAERHNILYAVIEATTNAIVHGSPEGARNHVHVTFYLCARRLIVDTVDQGPGFDPASLPPEAADSLSERGLGLRLMYGAMDRVEFFRDDAGMLVRLTKVLS